MKASISTQTLIGYLQSVLDEYLAEEERFGLDDRFVHKKFDGMIACKEMVESLIGEPVNLQRDGKVTVGF